jgi:hypothetical protein
MHAIALGSAQTGGTAVGIVAIIAVGLRLAMMFVRMRQRPSARRWPDDGPGGGGSGTGYGERPARPGGSGPAARRERPGQQQDHSYWEPEEQAGPLSADGYIGDPAEPDPPAGPPFPSS